jgi:tetratricopeptide (TPR) repeat protein
METQDFHRQAAHTLQTHYAESETPPEGWQGVLMWHWEQAGEYGEAIRVALARAQHHTGNLEFPEARRWIDHGLKLLERISGSERLKHEMQTYALTVAVLEFEGKFREALGYAQLILRLAETEGNIEAQGRGYLTLGRVHRELGQLTFAETELLHALQMAERHQMHELEWEARFHLAKVHQLQGRHLDAFQQLDLAHRRVTTVSDGESRLARVCTGIGDIYRVLGSGEEALQFYHRALKGEIGTENRLGQAILYEKLALSHMELDELFEAIECINEALQIRERLDDNLGKARSHSIMGTIQHRLKNYHLAQEHFERARSLEAHLQNRRGLTIALTNLGDVARSTGNTDQARLYYHEALKLTREIGDRVGMARVYERIGDAFHDTGDRELAQSHWQEALHIRDDMGHYDEAQSLRERLAT